MAAPEGVGSGHPRLPRVPPQRRYKDPGRQDGTSHASLLVPVVPAGPPPLSLVLRRDWLPRSRRSLHPQVAALHEAPSHLFLYGIPQEYMYRT